MDHKTSLTQHINAPAEKVWAVISDIPASAATLSSIDSIQMLTEGPYSVGTRWKETRSMLGRAETVEMWVSECEPPARIARFSQHHSQGPPGRRGLHHPFRPRRTQRRHRPHGDLGCRGSEPDPA